jgi:DNA-binding transcriptional ArsR family regulator
VSQTEPDDVLWSAISDPSRRRVLDLLVEEGPATASTLSTDVPFSRQAVTKHLVVLERAGLVARHRDGREVLFEVSATRLDEASRTMAGVAASWERRLVAIKRLAETAHHDSQRSD